MEVLPATLREVRAAHVDMHELQLLARLQDRLECGTVSVDELRVDGFGLYHSEALLASAAAGRRLPLVQDVDVSCANVPECVWALTCLTALSFSGSEKCARSPLQSIPGAIGRLRQLRSLSVHGCDSLTTLPPSIGALTALTNLQLRDCWAFKALPPALGELRALKTLDLEDLNALDSLPSELGQLSALKELHIRETRVEWLPMEIGELAALTSLEVNNCTLAMVTLPVEVSSLQSLSADCRSFPPEICELTGLTELSLYGNFSASELAPLSGLAGLQELQVYMYGVRGACPPFFAHLAALSSLTLCECKHMTALPPDLSDMTALQYLKVEEARALRAFPEGVTTLPALRSLEITEARFRCVPDSIGALATLESLSFEDCRRLRSLPESIGRLAALECLDLSDCSALAALPASLSQLTALKSKSLRGCKSLQGPEFKGLTAGRVRWIRLYDTDSEGSFDDADDRNSEDGSDVSDE